jgi:hypothetical protein
VQAALRCSARHSAHAMRSTIHRGRPHVRQRGSRPGIARRHRHASHAMRSAVLKPRPVVGHLLPRTSRRVAWGPRVRRHVFMKLLAPIVPRVWPRLRATVRLRRQAPEGVGRQGSHVRAERPELVQKPSKTCSRNPLVQDAAGVAGSRRTVGHTFEQGRRLLRRPGPEARMMYAQGSQRHAMKSASHPRGHCNQHPGTDQRRAEPWLT